MSGRGQRGRGRGRGPGREDAPAPQVPKQLCRKFVQGTCRFGKTCKFSHDQQTGDEVSTDQQERDEAQKRFHAWKRLRPGRAPASWISAALELLSQSADLRHQAIRFLASEECLPAITGLVEGVDTVRSTQKRREYLTEVILPFFGVLSHPKVIDSLVLEQEVGVLFRCLLGVDAARFTRLFDFIFHIVWESANHDGSLDEPTLQTLSISADVFAKLIDTSVTNIVNPAFHRVAEHFATFLDLPPGMKPGYWQIQIANRVTYAQMRLDIGKSLPDKPLARPTATDRAQFSVGQDLPGALSMHGPRHDNDHEDIKDISIMPTMEEIKSSREEYLPTITARSHLDGAQGLIDRQFRLMREDIFGDLRCAVRAELDNLASNASPTAAAQSHRTKVRRYDSPNASYVTFGYRHGLELEICILQPQFARKQEKVKRAEAWNGRLSQGALVCAVDEVGTAIFFLVSASTRVSAPSTEEGGRSLAGDPKFAYVWLQPVDKTEIGVVRVLSWYKGLSGPQKRRLLEFPGILLSSALPPLEALQRMSSSMDFPFQDILAAPEAVVDQLPAPLYSLRPGFSFDLSCLCKDGTKLDFNSSEKPDPATLSDHSSLDPTQAAAILNSLQRSIAITQGPPGTGKSYTGKAIIEVLLANKTNADLGPVICICYTNHALDQLLEDLLDNGIEQVVRIGSRSKSESLAKVNLWAVASHLTRTRTEGAALHLSRSALESDAETISEELQLFNHTSAHEMIESHIAKVLPRWHKDLFGEASAAEPGWSKANEKKDSKAVLKRWLQSGKTPTTQPRSLDKLVTLRSTDLSRHERLIIHQHWIQTASADLLSESTAELFSDYNAQHDRDEGLRAEINLRCLERANIIGITTTGLARNLDLIKKTRAKVLVCEEAGEVLEGHLLTAFLPSIEHVILIGDHLQLRPQIQDWRLQKANPAGEKYSLDVSLFERLVQSVEVVGADGARRSRPCIPFNILDTQRRMHPSVAELVRSTLYSSLIDADSVRNYPQVTGMARRLFWMNHSRLETNHEKQDATDTSHSNEFEVDMVSALVSHLLRQGEYEAGEIAVLAPYLGQLQKLRKALGATTQIVLNERDAEDLAEAELSAEADLRLGPLPPQLSRSLSLAEVRVATVDNFQGEEAKVVIVSLVRSNTDRRPGFLNTPNRTNVLLSRAKHGMYLIGNASTFSTVPMWADVIRLLESNGNFGPELLLQCPRHLSTEIRVQTPEDFNIKAPDVGCTQRCERRLHCGHACTGPCHADTLHRAVKCLEACARFKDGCDHTCPRVCGEPCEDRCNRILDRLDIALDCGHRVSSAPCWQAQDPAKIRCMVQVSKLVPGCGHSVKVPCSVDVAGPGYVCKQVCGVALPCGHTCRRKCRKCYERVEGEVKEGIHGDCTQVCDRNFTNCSHRCKQSCHGGSTCPPCEQPCESQCSHSKCSHVCSEPCVPCAEMSCSSECPHSQCRMPCAAPCDWVPCSLRCDKTLSCGHRCPSLCGERCPTAEFCQVCSSTKVKSLIVDLYAMAEYKDIDLDKEPCIFPDCGHPLTYTSMDAQMGMSDHYNMNSSGKPTAIKAPLVPFSSADEVKIRVCPHCRGPLRNVARYGRLVRRGLLDESTKRFLTWSAASLHKLTLELAAAEEGIESQTINQKQGKNPRKTTRLVDLTLPRRDRFKALCDSLPGTGKMWPVRVGLERHLAKVGKEEQPYQRVANRVRFGGFATGGEVEVQMGGYLKTLAMLLRCDIVILQHFFARHAKTKGNKIAMDEYIIDFQQIAEKANERQLWRLKAEGHILLARLCCIAHVYKQTLAGTLVAKQCPQELGMAEIQLARNVLALKPSTRDLQLQVDALETGFRETFYALVTGEERLAVYNAMSQELSGTGHWYTYEEGHPFTVGECGRPMELARCPECGGAVGGQRHIPAAGVQRATDMDELGREMEAMDV